MKRAQEVRPTFRARPDQRGNDRRHLPAARRSAAGTRAGSRPTADADARLAAGAARPAPARCWSAARSTCRRGSRRCARRSIGATSCSTSPSGSCCAGWRCLPAAAGWRRSSSSSPARTAAGRRRPSRPPGVSLTGGAGGGPPTNPAIDCWRPCASTPSKSWKRPAKLMRRAPHTWTGACTWSRRRSRCSAVRSKAPGWRDWTASTTTCAPRCAGGWTADCHERVLRLGAAFWRFWWTRAYFPEGQRWLEELLAF